MPLDNTHLLATLLSTKNGNGIVVKPTFNTSLEMADGYTPLEKKGTLLGVLVNGLTKMLPFKLN